MSQEPIKIEVKSKGIEQDTKKSKVKGIKSPYLYFSVETYKKLKVEHPQMKFAEIAKLIG